MLFKTTNFFVPHRRNSFIIENKREVFCHFFPPGVAIFLKQKKSCHFLIKTRPNGVESPHLDVKQWVNSSNKAFGEKGSLLRCGAMTNGPMASQRVDGQAEIIPLFSWYQHYLAIHMHILLTGILQFGILPLCFFYHWAFYHWAFY